LQPIFPAGLSLLVFLTHHPTRTTYNDLHSTPKKYNRIRRRDEENRIKKHQKNLTSQKLQHLQNFLFGFSSVFDTHNRINLLHPHLGVVLPFEFPIDDDLLPAISNPKKRKSKIRNRDWELNSKTKLKKKMITRLGTKFDNE